MSSHSISDGQPVQQAYSSEAPPVQSSDVAAVARSRIPDLAKGLAKSPTLRTLAFTAVVSAIALPLIFTFIASPPVWMIAAVVGGGILFGAGIQLPFKGKQKLEFEMSALGRLKGINYNEIITLPTGQKIFLGALPNRLKCEGERLRNQEEVGAVLSLNETWERTPVGLSLPYQEADWAELGVKYQGIDVLDHTLLDDDSLNRAADFIAEQVVAGQNVYVHCRAGVGRSAMAVAAYLVRYQGYTVEGAQALIISERSKSTIYKKTERLQEYAQNLTYTSDQLVSFGNGLFLGWPELQRASVDDAVLGFVRDKASSLAIVSYMIYFHDKTVDEAINLLKQHRPNVDLEAHRGALEALVSLDS